MQAQLEQVTGPVRGYFIAAYASQSQDRRHEFVSYFKVCAERPASYFDEAPILHKGSPHAASGQASAALEVAIRQATDLVSEWPEANELAAYRLARGLFSWEAAELGIY